MTFCTDLYGPKRMKTTDFGDLPNLLVDRNFNAPQFLSTDFDKDVRYSCV